MSNVSNLMREIGLRKKATEMKGEDDARKAPSGIIRQGVVRMYNPDKEFGFLEVDNCRNVHFRRITALKSGLTDRDFQLGARVSVIVWQIHEFGPEVKQFVPVGNGTRSSTSEEPSKPDTVKPSPPQPTRPSNAATETETAKPIPTSSSLELVDEWGKNNKRGIYPGGAEQLIIDHLTKQQVTTRDLLTAELVKAGYNKNTTHSALSRVHARGWFIENGGKLYGRPGRKTER
jgi:hypothetical protein